MSEENSHYEENTAQALSVDPPLVTDAESEVGNDNPHAKRPSVRHRCLGLRPVSLAIRGPAQERRAVGHVVIAGFFGVRPEDAHSKNTAAGDCARPRL